MAVPKTPTLLDIVAEGLQKAGDTDNFARARDNWIEEVKNDIWQRSFRDGNTRLKTLQRTAMSIGVVGQRKFSLPDDFDEEIDFCILDGSNEGICQSGGNSTVVLAGAEGISETDAVGSYITMISGTSLNQHRQIIAYDTGTKVVTVDENWDVGKQPAEGDEYFISNSTNILEEIHPSEESVNVPSGRPSLFSKFEEEVLFNYSLDKTYPIRLRYFASLPKIDLTEGAGTLISKIYLNWRSVLIQGIQAKSLENMGSPNFIVVKKIYEDMVGNLLLREIPFGGEWEGFEL